MSYLYKSKYGYDYEVSKEDDAEFEREIRELNNEADRILRELREEEDAERNSRSRVNHSGSFHTCHDDEKFEIGFNFTTRKIITTRPPKRRITGVNFGFIPRKGAYLEFDTETIG